MEADGSSDGSRNGEKRWRRREVKRLTGQFNAHLEKGVWLVAEEGFWAEFMLAAGRQPFDAAISKAVFRRQSLFTSAYGALLTPTACPKTRPATSAFWGIATILLRFYAFTCFYAFTVTHALL
ncbi:MAG: hypothetical protein WAU78_03115 [Roseiarcus sp.]